MSRKRKQGFSNAEKRKVANMPHPQEISDPIEYEDNCSCFHISEPPRTGFENGPDPFPKPPYIMKPIITRDGRGASIKWKMEGDEKLESNAMIVRNIAN
jgi:hypothetical protein